MRISLSIVALSLMAATGATAQAIIDNGTIQLGVDAYGQLNVPGGVPSPVEGTTYVGVRHMPTGNEATSHGCLCEGWGVGIGDTLTSGSANNNFGVFNLAPVSFTSTASTATSVVDMGGGALRVTHAFAPSSKTANLYEVDVTIVNTSGADITDLRYTRTFDWDVEPDTFNEVVTIVGTGTTTTLLASSNNGFEWSDPFGSRSDLGVLNSDTVDFGPRDHGTNFDFGFGALANGASFSFKIYYGAAGTETAALNALGQVQAELYSLGQPAGDPLGTGSNGTNPTSTFMFAFAKVGGTVVVPPVPLPASALLLLGGLGAFGGLRLRGRRAMAA